MSEKILIEASEVTKIYKTGEVEAIKDLLREYTTASPILPIELNNPWAPSSRIYNG